MMVFTTVVLDYISPRPKSHLCLSEKKAPVHSLVPSEGLASALSLLSSPALDSDDVEEVQPPSRGSRLPHELEQVSQDHRLDVRGLGQGGAPAPAP